MKADELTDCVAPVFLMQSDAYPRSPLLANQRNPALHRMPAATLGVRPYNLPYSRCARNM